MTFDLVKLLLLLVNDVNQKLSISADENVRPPNRAETFDMPTSRGVDPDKKVGGTRR